MTRNTDNKTALIFGVSGQDGAYLARLLLEKGYTVHGASRDAEAAKFDNLKHLGILDRIALHSTVQTDFSNVLQTIKKIQPDEIYNLSGQSSVGLSFTQPMDTMESISVGTFNLLEAIRTLGADTKFYNAASSECYGKTSTEGADEYTPFRPKSPYGVAKAAAFWHTANYREAYGLYACSGILFNHESPLRHPRFVTRKISQAAASIAAGSKDKMKLGDLSIERDWGWAPEYVEAIWSIIQQESPEDYVIATGESHTLEEFVAEAFNTVGLDWRDHVEVDESLFRPSDLAMSRANPDRVAKNLNWRAKKRMPEIARSMVLADQALLKGDKNWADDL